MKKFIKELKEITDPLDMLIYVFENNQYFGYDSYYSEVRDAIFLQVEKVIEQNNREEVRYET